MRINRKQDAEVRIPKQFTASEPSFQENGETKASRKEETVDAKLSCIRFESASQLECIINDKQQSQFTVTQSNNTDFHTQRVEPKQLWN